MSKHTEHIAFFIRQKLQLPALYVRAAALLLLALLLLRHRAAAAADLQQTGRPPGEQLENIGEQEQLPAYPGKEGLSDPPHLPQAGGRRP